ncbi:phosphoadenylyl-sulfate reductase [Limnoraphis robusta Tam1]|uniref:Phosphoadenosine 5'-phosphosulfate reductase n=1 Tax=Limnoraphis robusta CCNP1315 TaxID=3110306 RepID=A0ABU5U5B4_9CYAN|nr:phosphoadenylyl-sulfate reductase [Limnoraphis robusta]MEA5498170.1 phosphoadenylyl-sulfate reductase [Limnoraphis robusta BA-68 BA1]MEA5522329.1 phosphoadenylyl-sulfate reductase [Limnoraphis robusta CCNP1315]MEA5542327.1 phosphoadenylyl-sulfate reductase [Limnoraphis robusta Tam1]MEA5544499.1 phosphoadenylyl-sulfate reductase [Limnoraphis robusta CCNP1324]
MPHLNLVDTHLNGRQPHSLPSTTKGEGMGISQTPEINLDLVNQQLEESEATQIVQWGANTFGESLVMSTSFGIQSAVMLHLVTQVIPDIPIIWIDTGYLPAETYIFAEQLTERLNLNLKIYQSPISPARMEALHGRLWEKEDVESFNRYDYIRKVEPMQRALQELNATAWLAGLRSHQTEHRKTLRRVEKQSGRYKIYPILSWSSKQVYKYLSTYDLPYHPYFDLGYTTVGDWHSSRPLHATDTNERDTRFRGLKQECGLHLPKTEQEAKSLDSSSL